MRFLKWWVIICLTIVGLIFLIIYDGINYINEADFTKLSFIIFGLFCYCSIMVGYYTKIESLRSSQLKFPRLMVGIMTKLGMTGTVLGFIKMLATCLNKVDVNNAQSMQSVLAQMSHGMSTALVTTAAGLICSILLQLQIFNYES